ncbi:alpha/beta hydrolase [Bacteroidota bacterium]
MKKIIWLFSLSIAFLITSFGSNGKILFNQIFKSNVLNEEVLYNVYLPPDYNTEKEYPVLFYLHWFGGDNNAANELIIYFDSLITSNQFPELIIITPNAKICWYIDDYAGKYKYSTFFTSEFLPYVNKEYNLTSNPKKRAIMGNSMGGFGALRFTMLQPQQFGICVSSMAGISTKDQIVNDNDEDYITYHQNLYGNNLKGKDRLNDHFINNNPLYIAEKMDSEILRNIKWFIHTCDDDYHSLPNAELHSLFHRKWVKHEFRVTDGGHDGECVMKSLDDTIEFLKINLSFSN